MTDFPVGHQALGNCERYLPLSLLLHRKQQCSHLSGHELAYFFVIAGKTRTYPELRDFHIP